jgi:cytochrome c-type biogenesis protein CcmE
MKTKMIAKLLIGVFVIGGGISYFVYQAMQSSSAYYYSVDEISANSSTAKNYSLRIAGRVKTGSVERDLEKMNLSFTLAGSRAEIPVHYTGLVPDNFTEGREVVVEGRLDTTGVFQADMLLTRYESKYEVKIK